jgi:hypothetical protein
VDTRVGGKNNLTGKVKAGLPRPLPDQKVDETQTSYPFAFIRDTAAVQQNPACATGDSAGCASSFGTASATTASVTYTQAGPPNRMMPYVRPPTPFVTSSTTATTFAEAMASVSAPAPAAATAATSS